jgi:hypothetical protein
MRCAGMRCAGASRPVTRSSTRYRPTIPSGGGVSDLEALHGVVGGGHLGGVAPARGVTYLRCFRRFCARSWRTFACAGRHSGQRRA